MATCICVIEKVLERIMNIRMAIMAAVISSTAVFTVHGVDGFQGQILKCLQ